MTDLAPTTEPLDQGAAGDSKAPPGGIFWCGRLRVHAEDAILAHECARAYVDALYDYMQAPAPSCDEEQLERNRCLRSYAKAAIVAITQHMP